jgi:hypothetical protein
MDSNVLLSGDSEEDMFNSFGGIKRMKGEGKGKERKQFDDNSGGRRPEIEPHQFQHNQNENNSFLNNPYNYMHKNGHQRRRVMHTVADLASDFAFGDNISSTDDNLNVDVKSLLLYAKATNKTSSSNIQSPNQIATGTEINRLLGLGRVGDRGSNRYKRNTTNNANSFTEDSFLQNHLVLEQRASQDMHAIEENETLNTRIVTHESENPLGQSKSRRWQDLDEAISKRQLQLSTHGGLASGSSSSNGGRHQLFSSTATSSTTSKQHDTPSHELTHNSAHFQLRPSSSTYITPSLSESAPSLRFV